ncbi:MAG: GNAT family N-acetyltransferase [Raineya sp.]|nr:GNAT family N-acetyltransferase [Raineya sp.]
MSYQYNVYRNLSTQEVIQKFEPYTFPSFRQKSKVRNLREPFFVVEAVSKANEKVGVSVLELVYASPHNVLKVLSLWVAEEHRRRGIASNILRIAEKIALNNQINYLNIIFQDNWESFKWMPTLLQKLGWNKPEKRTILVKLAYTQVCNLPWFKLQEYPAMFKVVPWVELSQADYDYIREKQKNENWYSEELSPFQLPHILEPLGSLALKNQEDKVVGWLIVHKVAKRTVQFTSYFIDKAYRETPATFNLLVDSIERMYKADVGDDAIFMFNAENEKMMFFAKAIAGEHNRGAFTEVWVGQKWIQGQI